ncbi:MAG TPA: glycosyltransferase family 2 protein [Steroidobacteraceae bacterium]|nr:glycosyltransferase family 2 protein [Steroidobacteraceae bacterium]
MTDEIAAPRCQGRDVAAVLVTFHADAGFSARLGRISRQAGIVIVVDNGPADAENRLREIAADPAVELILNGENLGVARALNIGVRRAIALGYRWALLLDQDSEVKDDMVSTLLTVQASYPDGDRLAVIGSGFEVVGRQVSAAVADRVCQGEPWQEAPYVITSGSLLSLAAYSAIGPFREDFFIDSVDTEFCLRAAARGYRVIRTRKALMSHAIGSPTAHRWLWMTKSTSNHPPDRRYYMARNDTVMLREYGNYAAGIWALKSLRRCLRQSKRIVLYENMKASKIIAIAHGWWDGVRGRMGPRRRQAKSD